MVTKEYFNSPQMGDMLSYLIYTKHMPNYISNLHHSYTVSTVNLETNDTSDLVVSVTSKWVLIISLRIENHPFFMGMLLNFFPIFYCKTRGYQALKWTPNCCKTKEFKIEKTLFMTDDIKTQNFKVGKQTLLCKIRPYYVNAWNFWVKRAHFCFMLEKRPLFTWNSERWWNVPNLSNYDTIRTSKKQLCVQCTWGSSCGG